MLLTIFKVILQKAGEPLDGCLNIEEFTEVMKQLAKYDGLKKKLIVRKLSIKTITYVSYETHEALGFDNAVVISLSIDYLY